MDIPMGGIRIIKKLEKINKDDANFCNNEYISNKKIVEKLTTTPIIIEKNKFFYIFIHNYSPKNIFDLFERIVLKIKIYLKFLFYKNIFYIFQKKYLLDEDF
jgi:hypothetical protein